MKRVILFMLVIFYGSIYSFCQNNGEGVVIGKYQVINSKILGEKRRILVHLPLGYENTHLKYPVVYHLYGDFVMTYFANAASVIERLHDAKKMPQVILIGVDNTNRYRDLRPLKRDGSPGGSQNFIRYFKEELMPFVNKNYRTVDYSILVGPQAGACFGLYALMEHPGLFDAFILENSFGNPEKVNEYLVLKAKSFFKSEKSFNKFLFMKVKRESTNLQLALEEKSIIESNTPEGFRFMFRLNNQEDDFILSTDIKFGLKELFSQYELTRDINIRDLDDVKKYYKTLSEKLGFKVNISDRILRDTAIRLKQKGMVDETRRIFEYILELYPKSLDGLFQMAEMDVSRGRYKQAIDYYREFLKIRPKETMILNRLKWIEKFIARSAAYEIEQAMLSGGLEKGREAYQQLKKDKSNKKYFNEREYIIIGYRFLNAKKLNEAVEIFKISVELYPKSSNTWDSLGEAYMKKGNRVLALENYEKSLELNPNNDNAKKMLKILRQK